jgi:NADH dehydrogenase
VKSGASGGGRPKVVVVGGGFGGVNVTRQLAKTDVDVTIVDRTNHHLFQPLLYQVATGIMPEGLIAPALRRVVRGQRTPRLCSARRPISTWPGVRFRSSPRTGR